MRPACLRAFPSSSLDLFPTPLPAILWPMRSAVSAMRAEPTSEGVSGASASSPASSASIARRWACTLSFRVPMLLFTDFVHTEPNLFASASILVPSRKQASSVTSPKPRSMETSSAKTLSKAGRILSVLKRFTVQRSSGLMPQIQRNPMSSRVAWTILLEVYMPFA